MIDRADPLKINIKIKNPSLPKKVKKWNYIVYKYLFLFYKVSRK
jgi:hypothetical protein